jgi:alpha-N-arabinofuranosidase
VDWCRLARSDGTLTLLALHRHLHEPLALEAALPGHGRPRVVEALHLCDADLQAANTRDAPQRVRPSPLDGIATAVDRCAVTLQPASWNVIRQARAPT